MQALKHPLLIICATLCFIIFSFMMYQGKNSSKIDPDQYRILLEKNQALRTRRDIVLYQRDLIQPDFALEKALRNQYAKQREGELVFNLDSFVPDLSLDKLLPTPTPTPLQAWRSLFYGQQSGLLEF